jgi:hypothetical protein
MAPSLEPPLWHPKVADRCRFQPRMPAREHCPVHASSYTRSSLRRENHRDPGNEAPSKIRQCPHNVAKGEEPHHLPCPSRVLPALPLEAGEIANAAAERRHGRYCRRRARVSPMPLARSDVGVGRTFTTE